MLFARRHRPHGLLSIADPAYQSADLVAQAKLGIFAASLSSALIGLPASTIRHKRRNAG
jgi:Na+/H+ antiporter NhaA